MGMHDDDGIYTATCHYFRNNGTQGLPHGTSTTQHTSRGAAFEALNQALHPARADDASVVDVSLTRDDTAQTQVIFAAGPRHIDDVRRELDEQRSPYSRAWAILTTHANEILPELRNPYSPVHQPLSPELRDVAWAAQNVYDAGRMAVGGHDEPADEPFGYAQQHERLEAHLAGELDRAKGRARDAGHSEAQIDAAVRTDPDLDIASLRQHSADLLANVRALTEHPTLTPQQRQALLASADRAEDTVAELAASDGVPPVASSVNTRPGIGPAVPHDRSRESEIPPLIEQRQASNPPAHVLDYPYPPQSTPTAQTSLSNDDTRNRPVRRRDTDLGR